MILMNFLKCAAIAFIVLIPNFVTAAQASSDDAWAKLDAQTAKACIAASGFKNAKVSASSHFSDAAGYDVRMVSGTYPQKHMKGAAGQMLCLYGRKSKLVEVQELVK
jgi:hypothetical protein